MRVVHGDDVMIAFCWLSLRKTGFVGHRCLVVSCCR